jgi:uncharacterized membrane-anchored protein YitT (DUF2179 family)
VPLKAIRDIPFPERPGGYLDVDQLAPLLSDAAKLWIAQVVKLEENGAPVSAPRIVSTRISLPSDRSFASFDQALANFSAPPLSNRENAVWDQVLFDVHLDYTIASDRSSFAIHPAFGNLAARVVTVLRWYMPDGAVRAFEFTADPGMTILDPRWYQAALEFVKLGFRHILDGTDHLLFLLCLVIPCRRLVPLVAVVSAFAVAHSITLIASAFGYAPDNLWFPPLVEMLIALSIVYMAIENIIRPDGGTTHRRWWIAFGFGLIHGFGFSFALRETLQFAGTHLLTSLLSFNIGVELGQILVVALLAPLISALFRFVVAERMGTIVLSAFVAHTGWHWMIERYALLRKYSLEWPAVNAATLAALLRSLVVLLILAALFRRVERLRTARR